MKKFDFPLARVTRWSQQKLSVEQLALARIVSDLAELDGKIQNLRKQVTDGQSTLQTQSVLTGCELQTLAHFVQRLSEERERLKPFRARLVMKMEEQRKRVVAEHRRIKLFENLEGRRRAEWLQELSKEEDALASDLFLAKLARELREPDEISIENEPEGSTVEV